jgi:hypothetical protein
MCSNQSLHTHQTAREHGTVTTVRPAARKVSGTLSPTFRLFEGKIETLPATMKVLTSYRAEVEQAARSVGRIHQGPVTLGTGFVIGPNVIMTARHVAQSFASDVDGVLKIRIGWTPAIDFLAEEPPPFTGPDTAHEPSPKGEPWVPGATGRSNPAINLRAETMPTPHVRDYHQQPKDATNACYPIKSILYDNEEFDIALLLVPFASTMTAAEREARSEPRFEPLTLTLTTDAVTAERREVCVIGCPDEDPFATDAERNSIFKGVFDVKRVQPGQINRVLMEGAVLGHTCSTLRGNSGSPVIDLATNQVIGIHRRGSREQPGEPAMNDATALWLVPAAVADVLRKAQDIYAVRDEPVGTAAVAAEASASVGANGGATTVTSAPKKPAAASKGAGAIASA